MINRKELQQILDKTVDQKKVFGTAFCLEFNDFYWTGSSGDLSIEDDFFIASTTKLFITSLILQLKFQKKIHFQDPIRKFLDSAILKNLHIYKDVDYSNKITVEQLISHTSGLSDYFQEKNSKESSVMEKLLRGNDQIWSFEDAINWSKNVPPHFEPGTSKKAFYSDTNFQLLGKIIENITSQKLSEVLNEWIFKKLNLQHTYLYTISSNKSPKNIYYKEQELLIPHAMESFWADGGIVSNAQELMIFLKAFMQGILFPKEYILELKKWNRIFFPFQSGIGIHKFKLPWIFDPFQKTPELIGHSGLSGTIAFCNPEKNIYITGTVNQIAYPQTSFKTAIKLLHQVLNL